MEIVEDVYDVSIAPIFKFIMTMPPDQSVYVLTNLSKFLESTLISLLPHIPKEIKKDIEPMLALKNKSGGGPRRRQTRRKQRGGDCITRRVEELKRASSAFRALEAGLGTATSETDRQRYIAGIFMMEREFMTQAIEYCNRPGVVSAAYGEVKGAGKALIGVIAEREDKIVTAALAGGVAYASTLVPAGATGILRGVAFSGGAAVGTVVWPTVKLVVESWNAAAAWVPRAKTIAMPAVDPETLGRQAGGIIDGLARFMGDSGGKELGLFFLIMLFICLFLAFYTCNILLQKARGLSSMSMTPVSFGVSFNNGRRPLALPSAAAAAGAASGNAMRLTNRPPAPLPPAVERFVGLLAPSAASAAPPRLANAPAAGAAAAPQNPVPRVEEPNNHNGGRRYKTRRTYRR